MQTSSQGQRVAMIDAVESSFDYKSVPEDDAVELRACAQRIRRSLTDGVVAAGVELEAAKCRLPHGQYGPWIQAEFGLSENAARYMRRAAAWVRENEIFAVLAPSALYALTNKSTLVEVKDAVRARLEAGEVPRPKEVNALIARAKARQAQPGTSVSDRQTLGPANDESPAPQSTETEPDQCTSKPPEPSKAAVEQGRPEPEHAEQPIPQLGPSLDPTDFELEPGVRQLIEVLTDVILGDKSITEHAQTIMGLFTDCHLRPLADRFTNYLQETAHDPEPATSEHVTVVWSPPGIVDMIQPGVALTLRAQRAASGEIVLNRELSQRVKALMDASVAYDAARRVRGPD